MSPISKGEAINPEPISERVPPQFTEFLQYLWQQHFGSSGLLEAHLGYGEKAGLFAVTLEHLVKARHIRPDQRIFDETGRIRRDLNLPQIQNFAGEKPLKKLSVCSVGGMEAVVFAAMGAQATTIDPSVGADMRIKDLRHIHIPSSFDDQSASRLARGNYTVTTTWGMFDAGGPWREGQPDAFATAVLPKMMDWIVAMTKRGGLSVHAGSLVGLAARNLKQPVTILEESYISLGSKELIVVLERK